MTDLKPGQTGNEVLSTVVDDMEHEGITSSIYSHPIGDHMHGAGATTGLWDHHNGPVPIKGDIKVLAESWYSVELKVAHPVPEWGGQVVSSRQEEDAGVDALGKASWILERQSEYHIVAAVTKTAHKGVVKPGFPSSELA